MQIRCAEVDWAGQGGHFTEDWHSRIDDDHYDDQDQDHDDDSDDDDDDHHDDDGWERAGQSNHFAEN